MFLHRERSLDTITYLSIQALPAKQTPYSSVSLFHRVSGFPRRSPAPVEAVNPEGFEEPNHYSPGPAGGGALRLRSSLKILGSSFPASAGAGSDLLTKNRFCSRPSPAGGGGEAEGPRDLWKHALASPLGAWLGTGQDSGRGRGGGLEWSGEEGAGLQLECTPLEEEEQEKGRRRKEKGCKTRRWGLGWEGGRAWEMEEEEQAWKVKRRGIENRAGRWVDGK